MRKAAPNTNWQLVLTASSGSMRSNRRNCKSLAETVIGGCPMCSVKLVGQDGDMMNRPGFGRDLRGRHVRFW